MSNITDQILTERHATHGDFKDNARIAQRLRKAIAHNTAHLSDVQAEAINAILGKLARVCAGNGAFLDHWQDIIGYSQLVINDINNSDNDE